MKKRRKIAALLVILVLICTKGAFAMEGSFVLSGPIGDRFDRNTQNWLLQAPYNNPAMFEMFVARDKIPRQLLVPWYGEFPGKYLTSAVLCWRMSRDGALKGTIEYAVKRLLSVQAEDGYLGVFQEGNRLVGCHNPLYPKDMHWDVWGHYHCMLGLLLWYQQTGDKAAYNGLLRAADYVLNFFSKGDKRIEDAGWAETNMSVVHVYTLLYQETKKQKYLDFALRIVEAFKSPEGGNFLEDALAGLEFYQMRKPRWESLHSVQALYELFVITGEEQYKDAVLAIWRSIQKLDRHNTGGFSSGEQAQGDPYDPRAIETCCTVAWIALSIDVLKLTGSPEVADEIELSTLNAILGAQHPSGRYFTYNTPMAGVKQSSEHEIVFQAHAGSPELNCCSVNGPRGIGMIDEWGIILGNDEVYLNYYGAMRVERMLKDGGRLTIEQHTEYPVDGRIIIDVEQTGSMAHTLKLRIPRWSEACSVALDGGEGMFAQSGAYFEVPLTKERMRIEVNLDMSLHYWWGGGSMADQVSIYRGPILLAYDQRFNERDYTHPPTFDLADMQYLPVSGTEYPNPWLLLRFNTENGDALLCDFATAGATGMGYNTWLPVKGGHAPADLSTGSAVWCSR